MVKNYIDVGPSGFICLMIIPNVTVVLLFLLFDFMYDIFCVDCLNAGYMCYNLTFIQFTAYGYLLSGGCLFDRKLVVFFNFFFMFAYDPIIHPLLISIHMTYATRLFDYFFINFFIIWILLS